MTPSQGSLFDLVRERPDSPRVGLHHKAPRKTELAGALSVVPKSGTARFRYLEELVKARDRGLTDSEAAMALRIPLSSINARRNELMRSRGKDLASPYVKDSGKTRRGIHGNENIVWIPTTRGRDAVAEAWAN